MNGEPTTSTRILVVDDSRLMLRTAQKILSVEFDVVTAVDGEDAWEQLERDSTIQLVFTDLNMPRSDGYDLLRKVRTAEEPGLYNLPVILVTGDEDDESARQKALNLGATDFITKPFTSFRSGGARPCACQVPAHHQATAGAQHARSADRVGQRNRFPRAAAAGHLLRPPAPAGDDVDALVEFEGSAPLCSPSTARTLTEKLVVHVLQSRAQPDSQKRGHRGAAHVGLGRLRGLQTRCLAARWRESRAWWSICDARWPPIRRKWMADRSR